MCWFGVSGTRERLEREWRAVDLAGLPGQPQTVKPEPGDPLELRVRVWGSE